MPVMGLYDILKDAAKVAKEAGKIEQYKEILEVREKLLEMQERIADLEHENAELKRNQSAKSAMKYERNSYWTAEGDGPFCSKCLDSENKMVRTHPSGNPAFHHCPECKTTVKVFPEKDPPQRTIRHNYWS